MATSETEFPSIVDRITSVQDLPVYLKVEAYGRAGTGKTTFAGTFPKPLLIADVRERGTTSVRNQPDTFVAPIENWADFEDLYWYLAEQPHDFKTIVIDTVTPLQDLAIKEIAGEDITTISRRTWGEASSLMKTWILLYRDLPMHVVFLAQDRETGSDEVDEEGTILPEVGPYVMPSVAKILNAAVDIIGQTFIRERLVRGEDDLMDSVIEYCLRIGPHPRFLSKLRRDPTLVTEILPDVIRDPTYGKLVKLSTKELKRKVKKNATAKKKGSESEPKDK